MCCLVGDWSYCLFDSWGLIVLFPGYFCVFFVVLYWLAVVCFLLYDLRGFYIGFVSLKLFMFYFDCVVCGLLLPVCLCI